VQANILTRSLGNDIYEFDAVVNPAEPFPGAYVYFWDFGDDKFAFEKSPTHQYDGLSKYTATLDVTTDIGCSDVALADIYGNVLFYIPTAFTPDNDGLNDAFEITGRQIRLFEIWIYNRWGELLYHSTDLDEAWTGDVNGGTHFAPNGVYQWMIKATGFDTNAEEFRGSVLLMR
jgi:gliding motility-associated-like protein